MSKFWPHSTDWHLWQGADYCNPAHIGLWLRLFKIWVCDEMMRSCVSNFWSHSPYLASLAGAGYCNRTHERQLSKVWDESAKEVRKEQSTTEGLEVPRVPPPLHHSWLHSSSRGLSLTFGAWFGSLTLCVETMGCQSQPTHYTHVLIVANLWHGSNF